MEPRVRRWFRTRRGARHAWQGDREEALTEVNAPKGVCCEFTRHEETGRTLVHFVNLRKRPARDVSVRLCKELAQGARRVEFLGPHLNKAKRGKVSGGAKGFDVPAIEKYLVAVIERP